MVLIQDKATANLDDLAEELFVFLNPKIRGGSRHYVDSLIGKIQSQRNIDYNNAEWYRVSFWDYLLEPNYNNLHEIITGRPEIIKRKINEINEKFGNGIFSKSNGYTNASLTVFGEKVSEVFNFQTMYRGKQLCPENCRKFELQYCPYCNSSPMSIIDISEDLLGDELLQALLQVDHFYPQARYPYLSLSFFNLIPGCYPCNGPRKREKDFDIITHFNPFHKRLDDHFKFVVDLEELMKNNRVHIDCVPRAGHPANAITDFEIVKRYNDLHKDDVHRLFSTIKHHSIRVRRNILVQFKEYLPPIAAGRKRLLLANGVPTERNDINKYLVGKLKRDFCIQLEIPLAAV